MGQVKSIMIVGVGGQGSLLASKLMGNVLMAQGFDVKVSEVHGMAQRGGSVVTYVKYGEKVYSPVIEMGEADVIVAFEKLEAARWLPYLKQGGKLIVNDQQISPMPVITGAMAYPEEILEKLREKQVDVTALDAQRQGGQCCADRGALLDAGIPGRGLAGDDRKDCPGKVPRAEPPGVRAWARSLTYFKEKAVFTTD